jgi:UPF0755 protein
MTFLQLNRIRASAARVFGMLAVSLGLAGCAGSSRGDADTPNEVTFTIPARASFQEVSDTLVARGLVRQPTLFRVVARLRKDDRRIRSGLYRVPAGESWFGLLDRLVEGRVVTLPVTFPEGWTLRQIAPRMANFSGVPLETVEALLLDPEGHLRWALPGPGLEGYLFPDTYSFTPGTAPEAIVEAMVQRYRTLWTPERQARAAELGLSEQEVMTFASIVQAEARHVEEMPRISSVFHNRLRIGYLLQADPTVQYALGTRRARLLYRDIDAVADHPYNTYRRAGLPPGPIGAAGEAALDATLHPEDGNYLYFVARPDGTHIFTRTLDEHNRARVQARQLQAQAARSQGTPLATPASP